MLAIHRILCAVDFSETSERAATFAASLANKFGAELHFAHVWQMPVYAFPDGGVILGPDVVTQITADLQQNLDGVVSRHSEPGRSVQGHLMQGIPDREIVRLGKELAADWIVLGTHGRTGLSHLLLGSVAERVVRTSPVPVLTVPREDHKPR